MDRLVSVSTTFTDVPPRVQRSLACILALSQEFRQYETDGVDPDSKQDLSIPSVRHSELFNLKIVYRDDIAYRGGAVHSNGWLPDSAYEQNTWYNLKYWF